MCPSLVNDREFEEKNVTHKSPSSARAMDNQVGHVTDQVSGEAEVEEHVEDVEDHLPRVDGVKISVPDGGESGDGPVHRRHVANPQALFEEVLHRSSNPSLPWVVVTRREEVVEASRAVNREKGDLKKTNQNHHKP